MPLAVVCDNAYLPVTFTYDSASFQYKIGSLNFSSWSPGQWGFYVVTYLKNQNMFNFTLVHVNAAGRLQQTMWPQ